VWDGGEEGVGRREIKGQKGRWERLGTKGSVTYSVLYNDSILVRSKATITTALMDGEGKAYNDHGG
jgi:hypothetical protein